MPVGAFPEDAQHQGREERRSSERERCRYQEQDVRRLLSRYHAAAISATTSSRTLDMRHAACGRGVRVDHLVVQVVAERVGNRQQQAVSGGQRRSQAAGRHHARHHIRQATDFGRGQHDDVAADLQLTELQDFPSPLIRSTRQQARVDTCSSWRSRLEAGRWAVPTSTLKTSYLTSTASAGAVKYSRKMKNSDQVTDSRASLTLTAWCSSASGCAAARPYPPSGRRPAPGSCGGCNRRPVWPSRRHSGHQRYTAACAGMPARGLSLASVGCLGSWSRPLWPSAIGRAVQPDAFSAFCSSDSHGVGCLQVGHLLLGGGFLVGGQRSFRDVLELGAESGSTVSVNLR
jgi:hypothetical protein